MTVREVNHPYVVADPKQGVSLVFGLHWTPLIGSHSRRYARQRAAVLGATDYACAGSSGVALGWLRWSRRAARPPQGGQSMAAAAAFAAWAGQGMHVAVYRLAEARYWLVGARAGVVLSRTDRLFDNVDSARRAADDVRRALGIDLPLASRAEVLPCPDLATGCPPGAGLHRIGVLECALRRYRWPLAVACMGSAAFAVWRIAAPGFVAPVIGSAGEMVDTAALQNVDPIQVLQTALHDRWRGAPALAAVYSRFRQLPVRLDGWALGHARCLWENRIWVCRAQYVRDDNRATNRALADVIAGDWTVSFTPVDHAYLSWQEPEASQSPDWVDWPLSAEVDLNWISALQNIAPAFTHLSIGAPEIFAMDVGARSLGVARPHGFPRRRAIDAQGPMRSFALWPHAAHTVWTEVALTVREPASEALIDSRIHMLIRGWIHERDHAVD